MPRLSAGRVQSVATRIVVERERERMRFRAAGYWDLEGDLRQRAASVRSTPTSLQLDGARLATGKDFDRGRSTRRATTSRVLDEARRRGAGRATGATPRSRSRSVEEKPVHARRPSRAVHDVDAPAGGRAQAALRVAAHDAVAQRSTRTATSPTCAPTPPRCRTTALNAARARSAELLRRRTTCPTRPRRYEKKVKNAQEAHEAIRPAGDTFRTPEQVATRGRPRRGAVSTT